MEELKRIKLIIFCFSLIVALGGCKKYLDVKPSAKLVLPKTLQDLQALLDSESKINLNGVAAGEGSGDDYVLTDQNYLSLTADQKRLYTWEKDNIFAASAVSDWSRAYDRVFVANVVLDNIEKIEKTAANEIEWNDVKAQALFVRGNAFFEIVTTWSLTYEPSTANTDLGIPLRLTSDINEKITRPSLKQSYDQILKDLNEAIPLAKAQSIHAIRVSKPAVYALLSRIYLAMRDYENTMVNADACLKLKNDLLDFNNNPPLNPNAMVPFNNSALMYNNPEIIYASAMASASTFIIQNRRIDPQLYTSYDTDDLRKLVYFRDNGVLGFSFKGTLTGNQAFFFNGIAVDEVYLTRAECYARKSMVTEAMADLNTLMKKRWNKNVAYPTFTAANSTEALNLILTERRKELLMRGLRWMDIKRLNKEGANITLQRVVNGQTYTLPPNDNRYALAIPEYVINLNGIQQNPR